MGIEKIVVGLLIAIFIGLHADKKTLYQSVNVHSVGDVEKVDTLLVNLTPQFVLFHTKDTTLLLPLTVKPIPQKRFILYQTQRYKVQKFKHFIVVTNKQHNSMMFEVHKVNKSYNWKKKNRLFF